MHIKPSSQFFYVACATALLLIPASAYSTTLGTATAVGTGCSVVGSVVFNDSAQRILVCNGTSYAAFATAGSLPIDVDLAPANKRIISIDGGANPFLGYRGSENLYVGRNAGKGLDAGGAGAGNTLFGESAGQAITSGNYNTLLGYNVGVAITTGSGNTALGASSTLITLTTGSNNTALGVGAGRYLTSSNNTIIGTSAGNDITTGTGNIIIGFSAGSTLTTGSRNIIIGYDAETPAAGTSYYLNLGNVIYGTMGSSDTQVDTMDDFSASLRIDGNVGIGTTTPQSALHIPDGRFLQAEDNNAGAPPAADCDNDAERGRFSIDTTNNRFYICNGATRAWDYIPLTN